MKERIDLINMVWNRATSGEEGRPDIILLFAIFGVPMYVRREWR